MGFRFFKEYMFVFLVCFDIYTYICIYIDVSSVSMRSSVISCIYERIKRLDFIFRDFQTLFGAGAGEHFEGKNMSRELKFIMYRILYKSLKR